MRRPSRSESQPPAYPVTADSSAPTANTMGSSDFPSSSSIAQIAMNVQNVDAAIEAISVTVSTGRIAGSTSLPQISRASRRTIAIGRAYRRVEPVPG